MAISRKTELVLQRTFDPRDCRHYLNGEPVVLHCHHYMSLYSQLAMDCGLVDAKKLLSEVAEDTFLAVLTAYYQEHGIVSVPDRIAIAEQVYAAHGLGQIKVLAAGPDSGTAELTRSHVDSGWVKKWGKSEVPVNYFTCGYVAAVFAAVFARPARAFSSIETQSIACGAERSLFEVVAN